MRFTRPVWKYPYTVFARKNTTVQTLGDLDGKPVGFLRNDFVIQQLPLEFPNVRPVAVEFDDPGQALAALEAGQVDGFVTTGGGVEYEFLYAHPQLTLVAELKAITSDMTMAVAKDQAVLAGILDKYIAQREPVIRELVRSAERMYNRKIFRLTEAELRWLDDKGEAVAGVADDYLPFDYYHQGEYRGIAGAMLNRVADSLGVRLKVVSGSFAEILAQARAGKIDVINMAKTDERLRDFLFPHPISTERDIIVGLKTSPPVQDVYDLDAFRERCQSASYTVADGGSIHPSAALGYALREDAETSLDKCIAEADARMYVAKAQMKKRRSDASVRSRDGEI